MATPRTVLVTGAAPYLGGPQTWLPLRRAAPEFEFVEVDALGFADAPNMLDALRDALSAAVQGAAGMVAHFTAAAPAVEAIARVDSAIPLVLLSPLMFTTATRRRRFVRAVFSAPLFGVLLTAFARKKYRRLLTDRALAAKQLSMLVKTPTLDNALVDEACARLRDPRTARVIERTAETVRLMVQPVDAAADHAVQRRITIGKPICSPMLEAPHEVAAALRSLVQGTAPPRER